MPVKLTEAECLDIVRQKLNSQDYKFVGLTVQPLGEISGFMGDHYNLQINVSGSQGERVQLRLFAKCMATTGSQRDFILDNGTYYKEEQMCKRIIPDFLKNGLAVISECVPQCYLVRPMELFVFEDLSALGYKILNHRESLGLDAVKLVVSTMAKFNACGLILEEKTSERLGRPYRLTADYEKELAEAFYYRRDRGLEFSEACIKGTLTEIDYFGGTELNIDVEVFKRFTVDALRRFCEFVAPSSEFRNTICHADLWPTNFMYKFENDKPVHCKLVDFQYYRYSPPAQDVVTFLYLSTDKNFRGKHMAAVLEYYYAELKCVLEHYGVSIDKVVGYGEYVKSCEYYKLFAVAQCAVHFQLNMMNPEEFKDFFGQPERVRQTLFGDRTEQILKLLSSGRADYRQRLYESLMDLRDICAVSVPRVHE